MINVRAITNRSNASSIFKSLLIIVLLFIYIYNPPIQIGKLPFGISKYLSIFGIVVLWISRDREIGMLFKQYFYKPFVVGLIMLVFSIVRSFNIGIRNGINLDLILIFFYILPAGIFCVWLCKKWGKTQNDVINYLIIISFIQGCITIILFNYPNMNYFVQTSILSYDDRLLYAQVILDRSVGFGNGYLFSIPLFQGFAAALVVWKYFRDKKRFGIMLFMLPIILSNVLINARIGLIVFMVMLIWILAYNIIFISVNKTLKIVYLFFVALSLTYIIAAFVSSGEGKYDENLLWLGNAFDDAFGTASDNRQVNTFEELRYMIYYPANMIIGDGIFIFGNIDSNIQSDIGYILYLYYGGIVIICMFAVMLVVIFKIAVSNRNKKDYFTYLMTSLLMSILVVNMKGSVFPSTLFQAYWLLAVVNVVFVKQKVNNSFVERQLMNK